MKSEYPFSMVSVRLTEERPLISERQLATPEMAAEVLGKYIRDSDREMVAVICCDTKMRPICGSVCHIGTANQSLASPAEIMRPCILSGGPNLFLMHNHPSGLLDPSQEDIRLTDRMAKACDLCGLTLRDHIIVGHGRRDSFSFLEHGLLAPVQEAMTAETAGSYRSLAVDPAVSVCDSQPAYHAGRSNKRVKELTDRLEQGIKDLCRSENYRRYLDVMSRFHHYSPLNSLLIALQRPDASYVAGYTDWKRKFHRQVRMGEKSIGIFAPNPYRTKVRTNKIDPATGSVMRNPDGTPVTEEKEVVRMAYRVVSCFDVSQTDGEPLPEIVHPLDSSVHGYADMMRSLAAVSPVPIGYEDIANRSNGYFDPVHNRIAIRHGMSEAQTIKTTIHEISHSLLHAKGAEAEDHDPHTREVEPESVAYVVCRHYGIDTSDYSFGYIAGWSGGKELAELKESLALIRRTAAGLIDRIDGQMAERQERRAEAALSERNEHVPMRMA